MKKGPTGKRYSEVFKRQIVRDMERGVITATEVQKRYGVTGGMTIRGWLARYGKGHMATRVRVRSEDKEALKVRSLEREKRELERALARVTVEKVALESLIEEARSQGIELKIPRYIARTVQEISIERAMIPTLSLYVANKTIMLPGEY